VIVVVDVVAVVVVIVVVVAVDSLREFSTTTTTTTNDNGIDHDHDHDHDPCRSVGLAISDAVEDSLCQLVARVIRGLSSFDSRSFGRSAAAVS
jgi:hypothetical protein